jgi:hypothetical protein
MVLFNGLRLFESSRWDEPIQHEPNGGDLQHGLGRLNSILVIFAEAAIATEPGKAAFDYPSQPCNL